MSQEEMDQLYDSESSVTSHMDDYSESEDDDDDEDDVVFKYKKNVITKETPCYMRDFYDEAVLSPRWCKLTDEQKSKILDNDLDQYKNNK